MRNIITNFGKSLAVEKFKESITKYVLIGSSTKDNDHLKELLISDTSIIKYDNISDNKSDINRYIVTEPKDISDSMIDIEKRLVFTIGLKPNILPERVYIYGIMLLDENGNIYSVNSFTEPFNRVKDVGEIITIRHAIISNEQYPESIKLVSDAEAYITRQEFLNYANNHTHFDENVSLKQFNSAIQKLTASKVDKEIFGKLEDVNSLDNINLVNILNEIIGNIGIISHLETTTKANIVSAINELKKIFGNINDLGISSNNIVEALNKLIEKVDNIPEPEFKDNILVKNVNWSDKTSIEYVGNIDNFRGTNRDNIVECINETYDIATNKSGLKQFVVQSTGRYRFYSTNINNFRSDEYHLKFQPENTNNFVYIVMEVNNSPLLTMANTNAPVVNLKIVQSNYGDYSNANLDPYGIQVKAGTIGNDRIVELVFTKKGTLSYWGKYYQVTPILEYLGNPLEVSSYNDSYVNHPVRHMGGDMCFQDIGFLQTITSQDSMSAKMLFDSGIVKIGYTTAIALKKELHSLAFKKFGSQVTTNINNRVVRYVGADAGSTPGTVQESGVPNVTGQTYTGLDCNSASGAIIANSTGTIMNWNGQRNNLGITFNSNRISNQYINNLNEVRVKSIISNGYIRIF